MERNVVVGIDVGSWEKSYDLVGSKVYKDMALPFIYRTEISLTY
jgi:hypothetical protein